MKTEIGNKIKAIIYIKVIKEGFFSLNRATFLGMISQTDIIKKVRTTADTANCQLFKKFKYNWAYDYGTFY